MTCANFIVDHHTDLHYFCYRIAGCGRTRETLRVHDQNVRSKSPWPKLVRCHRLTPGAFPHMQHPTPAHACIRFKETDPAKPNLGSVAPMAPFEQLIAICFYLFVLGVPLVMVCRDAFTGARWRWRTLVFTGAHWLLPYVHIRPLRLMPHSASTPLHLTTST